VIYQCLDKVLGLWGREEPFAHALTSDGGLHLLPLLAACLKVHFDGGSFVDTSIFGRHGLEWQFKRDGTDQIIRNVPVTLPHHHHLVLLVVVAGGRRGGSSGGSSVGRVTVVFETKRQCRRVITSTVIVSVQKRIVVSHTVKIVCRGGGSFPSGT